MNGRNIKLNRIKRDLTQTQLAARIGVTQVTLSKFERNVYKPPDQLLKKILEVFKEIDKKE